MLKIKGLYTSAIVYGDSVEEEAILQIRTLCDQEFAEGSSIRVMPDAHVGIGCTVGVTMTIGKKVVPNLVGVDIGCGMETVELRGGTISFEKLDWFIRSYIPSGFSIRPVAHRYADKVEIDDLRCLSAIDRRRALLSVGTLGGGNHFIEVDRDDQGFLYLVVHSGSRHLGKQVAEHYQKKAKDKHKGLPRDLAYLEGEDFDDYIHDMKIVQRYADVNRRAITDGLLEVIGLEQLSRFSTIHNYIDTESMIMRKGAISARLDELMLIPINMRDGSLVCRGLGNPQWNYSAPHGAGRLLSRKAAKKHISLAEFESSMKGIWTTSVGPHTIDESPMAYKPMEAIIREIKDTAEILKIIRPVYNFKSP